MKTYFEFCGRYNLDPAEADSREEFKEYRHQLATLEDIFLGSKTVGSSGQFSEKKGGIKQQRVYK